MSSALQALLLGAALSAATLVAAAPAGEGFSHSEWSSLLEECVVSTADGHSTAVDYDCFDRRRETLDNYLDRLSGLSRADLLDMPQQAQLAFLINAYNAWTVDLILSDWPDLESIRDLGGLFSSPWKKSFIPLLGQQRSLDELEHEMIREPGRFDEPRIHFAVNCASIGCPALRREAYTGAQLEEQLAEQTRSFLADPSRNRLRNGELQLSPIFKWYRDDFEQGWRGAGTLGEFLARYSQSLGLSPAQTSQLRSGRMEIEFLEYDWQLNSTR